MAEITVRASVNLSELPVGQTVTVERTPRIDNMLRRGLLEEVVADPDAAAPAPAPATAAPAPSSPRSRPARPARGSSPRAGRSKGSAGRSAPPSGGS